METPVTLLQAFNTLLNAAAVVWLVRVENKLTRIQTLINFHGLDHTRRSSDPHNRRDDDSLLGDD
jgi:hypothetical protein